MKIAFSDYEAFDISRINYQIDDNNQPVDIIIKASEETLNIIDSRHSSFGCNMRILSEGEAFVYGATHEALFARLDNFNILNANSVYYE